MPSASRKGKGSVSSNPEKGTFIFPNGEKYEGDYIKTSGGSVQRHGTGTHHSQDGSVYSGCWVNDVMCGQGEISHNDGVTYKGEFSDGKYNGCGTIIWSDGSSFSGNFVDNRISGEGSFKDVNGRTWVGNFSGKHVKGLVLKIY